MLDLFYLKEDGIELLKKVKKHILEEPRRFVMNSWVLRKLDTNVVDEPEDKFCSDSGGKIKFAGCGTAACIGGWMVLLNDGMDADTRLGMFDRACELLGIPELKRGMIGSCPETALFAYSEWHKIKKGASEKYYKARSQKERAKIAGGVIDAYIRKFSRKEGTGKHA